MTGRKKVYSIRVFLGGKRGRRNVCRRLGWIGNGKTHVRSPSNWHRSLSPPPLVTKPAQVCRLFFFSAQRLHVPLLGLGSGNNSRLSTSNTSNDITVKYTVQIVIESPIV